MFLPILVTASAVQETPRLPDPALLDDLVRRTNAHPAFVAEYAAKPADGGPTKRARLERAVEEWKAGLTV